MPEFDLFGEVPEAPPSSARRARGGRQGGQAGGPPRPSATPPYMWFFALRPQAGDAVRIHAFASALLAERGITGKQLAPERLHISLEAAGLNIGPGMLEIACQAADKVHLPPIAARFDAVMNFNPLKGPLVLVGAKGGHGLDGVHRLRTALGCAMADRGFRPRCSYEPHISLCYELSGLIAPVLIEPIEIRIAEFVLIKSHVGRTRHELVRTWPLGA